MVKYKICYNLDIKVDCFDMLLHFGGDIMLSQYRNIIVAVDGSKEAELAFRKSLGITKRNIGSKLYITNILDTRIYTAFEGVSATAIAKTQEEIRQLCESYKKQGIAEGVENIEIIIENGLPKLDITKKIAQRINADLILCGATGHTKLERLLMGSVSEAIVRTASCDVLVVRTSE